MTNAICTLGQVPLFADADIRSGVVSQQLFGEELIVLEKAGAWLHIVRPFDNTDAWMEEKYQIGLRDDLLSDGASENGHRIVTAPHAALRTPEGRQVLMLPAGAIWPVPIGHSLQLGNTSLVPEYDGDLSLTGRNTDPERICRQWLSLPYVQGGRSGYGFDGGGLVQTLCRCMGVGIPQDCGQQAMLGETVNFMHEVRKGDLAFFDNEDGEIAHVGMILGEGQVVHCHREVSIDRIDQQGIFDTVAGRYSHRLRIIKRLLPEQETN
ncbi:MAG: hypothetical protein CSA96_08820 [Bacteroidetes bacterium]|nr:MAG: hypothetical protein CSA96_08820 [Bacteroidota bacterium]